MLNSNSFALAALVGLAAIFSSCSVKEDFDICKKSQVQLDVRAFSIEQSAFTKASGGHDRIVLCSRRSTLRMPWLSNRSSFEAREFRCPRFRVFFGLVHLYGGGA